MDLDQLSLFQKIARAQNISLVANDIGISQPALSNFLRRIEKEAGGKLFLRQGKTLILNEQGKIFFDMSYNMLKIYHRTQVSMDSGVPAENITITMTVPDEKLFETIDGFGKLYPQVRFTLYSASLAPKDLKLFSSEFLLAYEHEMDTASKISFDNLDQLYAILPKGHSLLKKSSLSLSDLKHEYFVFMKDRRLNSYELSYQACISSGFTPRVSVYTETLLDKYACIREGCGIGVAYRQQTTIPSHMLGSSVVSLTSSVPRRKINLFWKKNHLSAAGKLFIEFIKGEKDKKVHEH